MIVTKIYSLQSTVSEYYASVKSLNSFKRIALCKTLSPTFCSIGLMILNEPNITSKKIHTLELIIELLWFASQDSYYLKSVDSDLDIPFFASLDNHLAKSRINFQSDLTYGYLLIFCSKYRHSELTSLIDICIKNRNHNYLDLHQICLYKSKVANHCIKFGPCFFKLILDLANICKKTNGHWFIANVASSLKKAIEANISFESILSLYPNHIHPLVIQLRAFEQNFDKLSSLSNFKAIKARFVNKIEVYFQKEIYSRKEIEALLLIYPISAKIIVNNSSNLLNSS